MPSQQIPKQVELTANILTGIILLLSTTARAQVLVPLYSFDASDGPSSALIQGSDGNFYGTTSAGGTNGDGAVFQLTPGGTLATLINFAGTNGSNPVAGLVQGSDGSFYGTTEFGGSSGDGTVFQITPSGNLVTLGTFTGPNGRYPNAGVILWSNGDLYGTASVGGSADDGTVFKIPQGGSLTNLVTFQGTNGETPSIGLVRGNDGNLYGTTSAGGGGGGDVGSGDGTVFKMTTGGALTTIVNFNGTNGAYPNGLIQGKDGNLYGTTGSGGGSNGNGSGTVFQLTLGGVLTTLVSFNETNGSEPDAGVIQGNDGNLYGTTYSSYDPYANGPGTVFRVTPGGRFTLVDTFNGTNGSGPATSLLQGADGNFYGTTSTGGTNGGGVIYKFRPPAPLLYDWTTATPPIPSKQLTSVAYGVTNYVAVGYNGTVLSSPDGANWTVQNSGTTLNLYGVTYADGLFVAVGQVIISSPDGVHWSTRYSASGLVLETVAYLNGLFFAIGDNTSMFVSSTGVSWFSRASPSPGSTLYGIAFGNGIYVITGDAGSLWTSPNAMTWTLHTPIPFQTLDYVTYGAGLFVVEGNDGAIITSPDGTNWTARASGASASADFTTAAYGDGNFVMVGARGTIITSSDGITWTSRNAGTSALLLGATFGGPATNSTFVVVGNAGVILQSDAIPLPSPTLVPLPQLLNGSFQFTFSNNSPAAFTVLGTSDLSLSASNWTVLGKATQTSPGNFQFTDSQASNRAAEFYQLRFP